MKAQTDSELLRSYAESRSESAFTELVRRHVDFVYSAALRMICDPHLAEDATQGVFVALAKNAGHLVHHPQLSGWLHRTAHNIAAQNVRTIERRRAREKEAALMNESLSGESDVAWEEIVPELDAALLEMDDSDRGALLLRYFERKSAREMGQLLGISDEAAQKRVNRAVERLRDLFSRRGIAVGASGLVVAISANAVQAAPAGLGAAISSAVIVSQTSLASAATVFSNQTMTMTMTAVQKGIVATAAAVVIAVGFYETARAKKFDTEKRHLELRQTSLAEQNDSLLRERDEISNKLAVTAVEMDKLKEQAAEVFKLRAETARLSAELAQNKAATIDPMAETIKMWIGRVKKIQQRFLELPEQEIPELRFLDDTDWLDVAKDNGVDDEEGLRDAMADARRKGKWTTARYIHGGLKKYLEAHDNELPANVLYLQSYIDCGCVDNEVLARYEMLRSGKYHDEQPVPGKNHPGLITEKAHVEGDSVRIIITKNDWYPQEWSKAEKTSSGQ